MKNLFKGANGMFAFSNVKNNQNKSKVVNDKKAVNDFWFAETIASGTDGSIAISYKHNEFYD